MFVFSVNEKYYWNESEAEVEITTKTALSAVLRSPYARISMRTHSTVWLSHFDACKYPLWLRMCLLCLTLFHMLILDDHSKCSTVVRTLRPFLPKRRDFNSPTHTYAFPTTILPHKSMHDDNEHKEDNQFNIAVLYTSSNTHTYRHTHNAEDDGGFYVRCVHSNEKRETTSEQTNEPTIKHTTHGKYVYIHRSFFQTHATNECRTHSKQHCTRAAHSLAARRWRRTMISSDERIISKLAITISSIIIILISFSLQMANTIKKMHGKRNSRLFVNHIHTHTHTARILFFSPVALFRSTLFTTIVTVCCFATITF